MKRELAERLMTPAEVAAVFGVDAKSVTRWAVAGKLSAVRTLGNHRRYAVSEIRAALLAGGSTPAEVDALLAGVGR